MCGMNHTKSHVPFEFQFAVGLPVRSTGGNRLAGIAEMLGSHDHKASLQRRFCERESDHCLIARCDAVWGVVHFQSK
jgi:hypothetical protein